MSRLLVVSPISLTTKVFSYSHDHILRNWYPHVVYPNNSSSIHHIRHPLHLACLSDANNVAIIEKLLATYPDAASKFDSADHLLPLHIAAQQCATPECLKLLYDAYPQGIKLKTKNDGLLPLHLSCQNRDVYPKTVAALLELYPDAAKEAANDGSLPLHVASQSGCSMSVLKVLFEANPHAMTDKNKRGDTPFKCAEGKQGSQRNLTQLEEQGTAHAQ